MELQTHTNDATISTIQLDSHIYGGPQSIEFAGLVDSALANNVRYIIVDASSVEIMNSSGLGMLVNAHTTTSKQNASIALVGVPDKLFQLLKMTRLDSVLSIFSSQDEALAQKPA